MRSRFRNTVAGLMLLAGALVVAAPATPARASANKGGQVTTFTAPSINGPDGITVGPDGALWFTNTNGNSIGRITTTGVVSSFTGTGIDQPTAITTGPDGALWFLNTGNDSIGRITTSGNVTNFTGPDMEGLFDITAGPDGALWFTSRYSNAIGRITTTGSVSAFTGPHIEGPGAITTGPDGALWFTDLAVNWIGRITRSGSVSKYTVGYGAYGSSIVSGPNGALWYANEATPQVGWITTKGKSGGYPATTLNWGFWGLAVGPDGKLWFTADKRKDGVGAVVGTITTSGTFTNYQVGDPTSRSQHTLGDIVAGPDGAMWFTDTTMSTIDRVTVPPYLLVSPSSGKAHKTVTATAGGFDAGEPVTVRYATGLTSPAKIAICSADASATGTISCTGTVPSSAHTGTTGAHTLTARGSTSHSTATATYTLT